MLPFVEKIEQVKNFVFKAPEILESNNFLKQTDNSFLFDYGPSFAQLQL